MIQWIRAQKWLPSIILFSLCEITFGLLDYQLQGLPALVASLVLGASVLLARNLPWLSIGVMGLGTVLEAAFGVKPVLGGFAVNLSVFILAFNADKLIRWIGLGSATVGGVLTVAIACYFTPLLSQIYGLSIYDSVGRGFAFLFGSALMITANASFFLLGRLAQTTWAHVGTDQDIQLVSAEQSRLNLELAEQSERFGIARDITELIVQRVSALIGLVEGASYAAKVDAQAGVRALDRIAEVSRETHGELRRLYDMMNRHHDIVPTPPNLSQVETLAIRYRELGYSVTVSHSGEPFGLSDGAQLAIYRIVYDALENIESHVVRGASVTVDFSWANDGLQVLIKDNGIETVNRAAAADSSGSDSDAGYSVDEDLKALVVPVTGAGISAMRDRAALYGGTVEAHRVPGVGFTLSAVFPMLRTLGASSSARS